MHEQPTKERKDVSFPWILVLIIGFLYYSGDVNFSFIITEGGLEELETEYEYWEKRKPLKRKPRKLNFEDFVITKGRKWEITSKRLRKLQNHLDKYDDAETYTLIALYDGERDCITCYDQYGDDSMFLKEGEVFKVGVSLISEARYTPAFYKQHGVEYVRVHKGDYTECLKKEKELIFYYPITPENIRRKKPLVRPPYNRNDN